MNWSVMRLAPVSLSLLIVTAIIGSGCGPKAISIPSRLSAEESADKAMESYDSDSNGQIEKAELEAAHALAAGLSTLDSDGNSSISRDEILGRIQAYDNLSKMIALSVSVSDENGPVADAKVTLTPEAFMGGQYQPYEGVTDANGQAEVDGVESSCPAVPVGFYRVDISANGKQVTRGCEIADDATGGRLMLSLDDKPTRKRGNSRRP